MALPGRALLPARRAVLGCWSRQTFSTQAVTAAPTLSAAVAVATAPSADTLERTASISVHKGFKIQAALCVERPPLRALEPEWKQRWRVFKDAWERRTNNQMAVDDEIVFMRYHFSFLEDVRDRKAIAGDEAAQKALSAPQDGLEAGSGGLNSLLSQEGIGLEFPQLGKRAGRRKKVEKKVEEVVDDKDLRSPKRLADRSLFLLVRYAKGTRWTFPKVDRAHGQAMRETLFRLCGRQLGPDFEPYVLGACPFAHRKRRGTVHPGIDGRKIFYYRARAVPGAASAVTLTEDSPIVDWAWCSREELTRYLDAGEWYTVREGLPLDAVGA